MLNLARREGIRRTAALIGAMCGLGLAQAGADTRIVGSDLMGIEFTRELLAFATTKSQTIALAFDGSRRGLQELKAGRADLALLVAPPNAEPLEAFVSVPIGYHAVIVAVPSSCPLTEITLAQLARAFGDDASPLPLRWESLGVTNAWAADQIVPLAPTSGSSLLADYFRHTVLGDHEWKSITRRYATTAELRLQFADETKAIALVAHERELPAGVKMLAVAADAQRRACLPTAANLRASEYPLRLPLNVMFRRGRGDELADLLRFFLSDSAAGLLERANIIPIPASARVEELAQLAQR
jgi:phosphate transport system substrate-binding protein